MTMRYLGLFLSLILTVGCARPAALPPVPEEPPPPPPAAVTPDLSKFHPDLARRYQDGASDLEVLLLLSEAPTDRLIQSLREAAGPFTVRTRTHGHIYGLTIQAAAHEIARLSLQPAVSELQVGWPPQPVPYEIGLFGIVTGSEEGMWLLHPCVGDVLCKAPEPDAYLVKLENLGTASIVAGERFVIKGWIGPSLGGRVVVVVTSEHGVIPKDRIEGGP